MLVTATVADNKQLDKATGDFRARAGEARLTIRQAPPGDFDRDPRWPQDAWPPSPTPVGKAEGFVVPRSIVESVAGGD